MLVYGDRHEQVDAQFRAREINRSLDAVERMGPGLARHAKLVTALIETGQLLQGIADSAFADRGCDCANGQAEELGATLLGIARAVCASWDSGFAQLAALPRVEARADWPHQADVRAPEGFAFYAVYPEAYIEAARRLRLEAPPRVIGIRSIGTSLGAVVAAALGAPAPVTVRPFGDPAGREIAVGRNLEAELLNGDAYYVIVDEGPGQSGSSFAAVAEWLRLRGVPAERIAVLPSHTGSPGSAATEARRRWWDSTQRRPADFAERWPELIARWCEPLLGRLGEEPVDISAGEWRRLRYADESQWPPIVAAWERRKFLVSGGGEAFLVKFAGLGRIGEEKLAMAKSLHAEGFTPEPVGLAHGFLVERWCDAAPLRQADKPLAEIARYIGMRAQLFPASSDSGATVDELVAMIQRNVSLEFGGHFAEAVDDWASEAADLERRIVRVRTDNQLEPHEWLRTSSGAILKTDALDHHRAHDLIGCHDVAWDVAGALIEFDVAQEAARSFVAAVSNWSQRPVDDRLLQFYRIAYLAFRLGQARLGRSMVGEGDEQQRLTRRGDVYAAQLQHLLQSRAAATPPESLVG